MGFLGTAAAFIVTVVTALLFGFMVQRMLGLRLGVVRLLLGGVFAVAVTQPVLVNVVDRISRDGYNDKRLWWFLLLAAFVVLFASMLFLVMAEAFVPYGSVPPARGMGTWDQGPGETFRQVHPDSPDRIPAWSVAVSQRQPPSRTRHPARQDPVRPGDHRGPR